MMLIGLVWVYWWYIISFEIFCKLVLMGGVFYSFLYNKWYFDEFYNFLFVNLVKWIGCFLWKCGDGWFIDGFGLEGVVNMVFEIIKCVVCL